ncbi:MAG: hypothetical protein J6K28_01995 [Alistipes sp.]|nr:hypothetical protein [Alistipes sp.]
MKTFFAWLRRYISPVFIALFVASFILWYIAKLNYTYTADYDVKLNIDGNRIEVPCVIEGQGTNLLNHKLKIGSRLRIPLSELVYSYDADEDGNEIIIIEQRSLKNAVSVRMSDIKIVSLGDVPVIRKARTDD